MMVNTVRERAIEELRRLVLDALGEHDAEVWLFGSCARGEVFRHSDIDVATLPRGELPAGFFSELAESVEESSSASFTRCASPPDSVVALCPSRM